MNLPTSQLINENVFIYLMSGIVVFFAILGEQVSRNVLILARHTHMRTVWLFLGLLTVSLAQAQDAAEPRDNTPKYSNEFLQLGVGARAFGMSLSAVAITTDVTSGYWNPAGLLSLEKNQGMLMHASYFGGLANYDYAAYATTLDEESKLAVSIIRFSVDDIPDTRFLFDANGSINYDNIRFFAAADYAVIGSYARRLPLFSGIDAGGNVKIIHRNVGEFSKAWGFGIDAGLQKTFNNWQLGLMARDVLGTFNAWSHNVEELEDTYAITGNEIPTNSLEITVPRVILGAARSFTISDQFGLLTSMDMDFTFDGKRNTVVRSKFTSIDPHAGLEVDYKEQVFLRLGIGQFQKVENFNKKKHWTMQPTAGLGFKLNQVVIDYALTDAFNQAEGLYSHVFSIKIDFDAKD